MNDRERQLLDAGIFALAAGEPSAALVPLLQLQGEDQARRDQAPMRAVQREIRKQTKAQEKAAKAARRRRRRSPQKAQFDQLAVELIRSGLV